MKVSGFGRNDRRERVVRVADIPDWRAAQKHVGCSSDQTCVACGTVLYLSVARSGAVVLGCPNYRACRSKPVQVWYPSGESSVERVFLRDELGEPIEHPAT